MQKANNPSLPLGLTSTLSPQLTWTHFEQLDSTNAYLIDVKKKTNQLVSADNQTEGRGRRQQKWIDEGNSALFSLSLEFDKGQDISAWPVQVALTLATTLNQLIKHYHASIHPHQKIKVKWPNDLYTLSHEQWGKCGGILVESAIGIQSKVVTGIGLNLAPIKTDITNEYALSFINLPLSKRDLICLLANQILLAWKKFLETSSISTREYQNVDQLFGASLIATDMHSNRQQQGVGAGINSQGHLLLQQGNQIITLTSQQRIRFTND